MMGGAACPPSCLDNRNMKFLHNARIYTLESVHPIASVLVIDSGQVVAVGGEELLAGVEHAEGENMHGRVILPGLTDAHIHLQEYARSLQAVDCEGLSRLEILHRMAGCLAETPPGAWLQGHGWNQNDWGGGWPGAAELDAIAPHNLVYLTAKSLHAAWVNTAALQLAGISASTLDPANGSIQRDEHGSPTGILFEEALKLVETVIPEPGVEVLAKTFLELIPKLWRMGITGVHDFDGRTCFMALQFLHSRGQLRLRVLKSIPFELMSQAVALGLRSGFGNDFLRIGSIKLFADGALGPHTAAMVAPYVDEPQNRGILLLKAEDIFDYGCRAAAGGLSLAVHAIGDRAVHEVLDGFARLRKYEQEHALPALRHRMEHIQTILPEDSGRLAGLDLIASMQPVHAPQTCPWQTGCSVTGLRYPMPGTPNRSLAPPWLLVRMRRLKAPIRFMGCMLPSPGAALTVPRDRLAGSLNSA